MDVDIIYNEIDRDKVKRFVDAISCSGWMLTADELAIDEVMNNAVAIQECFLQEEQTEFHREIITSYTGIDFKKSLDLLIENFIKNSNLNEKLTLYAIRKYVILNPANNLCSILENVLFEIKLRENLSQLYEILSDNKVVDVDWHKIDSLLQEINSSKGEICDLKILNALKTQASVMLNAVEHGSQAGGQMLLQSMIECLESQTDLKLWFSLMQEKNIDLILDLCTKHSNFLEAVLKFFDKFADEIETNYDEDLNFQYSHLNMDFDDFVVILRMFLAEKKISKVISDFMENKIMLEDKNFLFWVDIKACL